MSINIKKLNLCFIYDPSQRSSALCKASTAPPCARAGALLSYMAVPQLKTREHMLGHGPRTAPGQEPGLQGHSERQGLQECNYGR